MFRDHTITISSRRRASHLAFRSSALCALAAVVLLAFPIGDVAADTTVWWQMNDGEKTHAVVEYEEDDGSHTWWYVVKYESDEFYVWYPIEDVDNPADPVYGTGTEGPSDRDGLLQLAKQKGGQFEFRPNAFKTPLGDILIRQGGTIVSHWNPADVFRDAGWEGGGAGGGSIDPNGGPLSEQIKTNHGNGNNNNGGGDDGHKEDHGFYDGQYPANPELVNPVPIQKSFILVPPTMAVSPRGASQGLSAKMTFGSGGFSQTKWVGRSATTMHGASALRSSGGLNIGSAARPVTGLKLSR
ncbi:MAG: hypothetical protein L0211_06210 [Planctomycetaceae bacterium]|nr:hypothetical protein [Planctomycetaceae bacterium]